jgi:hypothetical protein
MELRHNRPWPNAATSFNRESLSSLRFDHRLFSVGISGRFRRNAHVTALLRNVPVLSAHYSPPVIGIRSSSHSDGERRFLPLDIRLPFSTYDTYDTYVNKSKWFFFHLGRCATPQDVDRDEARRHAEEVHAWLMARSTPTIPNVQPVPRRRRLARATPSVARATATR